MLKVCEECKTEFNARRSINQFCSRRCLAFARHRNRGHGKKPIICATCGKTVLMGSYQASVQKYCSRACYKLRETKWSRSFNCAHCGKEVVRVKHTHFNAAAKFCSVQCRAESRRKGGTTTSQGYRAIHLKGKPILEHRHVMEQTLGRSLTREETVHHRNGQRTDNRPDNLELWSKSQPAGQRVEEKIAWAIGFLQLYGYQVSAPAS